MAFYRSYDWLKLCSKWKGRGAGSLEFHLVYFFIVFFFRFILFSFVCPVLSCFINFIFSSYVISYLMYFVMIERKKILTGFPLLSRTCITHITCSRRQKSPWLLLNWSPKVESSLSSSFFMNSEWGFFVYSTR